MGVVTAYYFMAMLTTLGAIGSVWLTFIIAKTAGLSNGLKWFWTVAMSMAVLINIALTILFLYEAGYYG